MSQTITAMYETKAAAEAALDMLVTAGVSRSAIRIVPGATTTTQRTGTSYDYTRDEGGFWASLKDLFLPDEDRYAYSEGLSRGKTMLTVTAEDAHVTRVMDILEEEGSVDIEELETNWRAEGWTGYPAAGAAATGTTAAMAGSAGVKTSGNSATYAKDTYAKGRADEEVIPVVEEKLSVGKRVAEHGRVRIRSYVVETPVQEQVTLSSEHVHVDRRVVDRPVTAADEALFAEKTIEAVERDEVAVVAKEARVVGEVGIRKDMQSRTETVTDKVRRTEVEVEDGRTTTRVDGRTDTKVAADVK